MSKDPKESDDSRLVRECLHGDPQAQRELVDRFAGLCRHIGLKVLSNEAESHVDDVVQETLAAVFKNLGQWRGENLAAWIGTIAAHRAADSRRRRQREPERAAGPAGEILAELPGKRWSRPSEMVELLDSLSERLSDRQKRVLDGILSGCSRSEVAADLGISQRTLYYELGVIEQAIEETRKESAKKGLT